MCFACHQVVKSGVCQRDNTQNLRASTRRQTSNNDEQVYVRCIFASALGACSINTAGVLVKQPVEKRQFRRIVPRSARM